MPSMTVEINAAQEKYTLDDEQIAELEKRFTYHKPLDGQAERYLAIRDLAKLFAQVVMEQTPPTREQSLALTHIEDAVMWANAAIARNEK